MAIFIEHVNVTLQRLRQTPITVLSTDTSDVAYRVQLAVQRAIVRVWNAKQWTFKQRKTTLALSSGTSEYNLGKDVGEPYICLLSASPYLVRPFAEEDFDTRIPNPTATGNPEKYMLFEYAGVETQPTAASALTLASSSASDTTQQVLIRGVVSGQEDYEIATLNGTTSVVTSKQFTSVRSISKSAETAGRITITSNSAAVTVLTLGPLEKTTRLKKVRFYPTPTSTLTATIKHFKQPFVPTQALDDSEIPSRWDYVVEQWAFAMALQPQGQDQISEQQAQFNLAEKYLNEDMASEESQTATSIIVPRRGLDDGTNYEGLLRSDVDGYSFEI
jgi:hypothetical protein